MRATTMMMTIMTIARNVHLMIVLAGDLARR
jgi:hypothetical protein